MLRKLKRDYGVKVVATRERPGANLVINCDDYVGQHSSICNKQVASHETVYQAQPMGRVQVQPEEAVAMAPRQRASAYEQVERVPMPANEPAHYYAREVSSEGGQPGEESRGEGAHQAAAHERMSEETGGATYENQSHEEGHKLSHPSESSEASPESVAHTDPHVAAARSDEGHESYELGAGFEEHRGAEEQSWQPAATDGGESTLGQSVAEWSAPSDEPKQAEPAESYPEAKAATR